MATLPRLEVEQEPSYVNTLNGCTVVPLPVYLHGVESSARQEDYQRIILTVHLVDQSGNDLLGTTTISTAIVSESSHGKVSLRFVLHNFCLPDQGKYRYVAVLKPKDAVIRLTNTWTRLKFSAVDFRNQNTGLRQKRSAPIIASVSTSVIQVLAKNELSKSLRDKA